VLGFARGISSSIGLTPLAETLGEFFETFASTVGLMVANVRTLTITRTKAAAFGLAAVLSRGVGRVVTALQGLSSTISRGMSYGLASSVGLISAVGRTVSSLRQLATQVGVIPLAETLGEFILEVAVAVGLYTSRIRTFALQRAQAALQGLTALRVKEVGKTLASSVGLVISLWRGVGRVVKTSVGQVASISRLINTLRTVSAAVGITPLAESLGEFIRELVAVLGLVSVRTRMIVMTRIRSTTSGLASLVSRGVGRGVATAFGLTSVVSRTGAFMRGVLSTLGLITTLTRGITRGVSSSVGVVSLNKRLSTFLRGAGALLGLVSSRAIGFSRLFTSVFGVVATPLKEIGKLLLAKVGLSSTIARFFKVVGYKSLIFVRSIYNLIFDRGH
jgi:hypothetical protein